MYVALVGEDAEYKKATCQAVLGMTGAMIDLLSSSDVPAWLTSINATLTAYRDNRLAADEFLQNLLTTQDALTSHDWNSSDLEGLNLDFDSIYQRYKRANRLSELFDKIIQILEQILADANFDSVSRRRDLEKVVATLKRNKDGSYFSLLGAWQFLVLFVKNYLWAELSGLPVFGSALSALKDTMEETNTAMEKLHVEMNDEICREVETMHKSLESKKSFPNITYDKSGYLLPALPASEHIDAAKSGAKKES